MPVNLVGCGRVKDGIKYIERWLREMLLVCDSVCVLDDGSTDGTKEYLVKAASANPKIFLHLQKNLPRHGGRDCRILYAMAGLLGAQWIWAPDVDEFLEPERFSLLKKLVELPEDQDDILGWSFPFFYLWDREDMYRADGDYANCHVIRLFKYDKNLKPADRPSHSQLCPDELDRRLVRKAPIRMIHYGYFEKSQREEKFAYYTRRDADPQLAGGGVKSYNHIIDPNPTLLKFEERGEWFGGKCGDEKVPISYHPNKAQLGAYTPIPGFVFSGPSDYNEIYVRKYFEYDSHKNTQPALDRFFKILHSGGRLDVSVPDFPDQCKAFLDASPETKDFQLLSMYAGFEERPILTAFWEEKLTILLERAGFHRIERLPVKNLHMMAFKP